MKTTPMNKVQSNDSSNKSIVIIGAGIAGLSAGCYARMNGYEATIFELHNKPGGLCTSWRRKGYTIDGCLHWLIGSAPGIAFHGIWQELGALQGREIINHEEFVRIQSPEGKTLIVYTDIDRLEKHLLELSPQDGRSIRKLTKAIQLLAEGFPKFNDLPPIGKPAELINLKDVLKLMKHSRLGATLKKWNKISFQDFAAQFKDPFLKRAIPQIFYNIPDFVMTAGLIQLSSMHMKSAGYPIGGSLEFSRAIEQRFIKLGGKVQYKAPVAKIMVQDNRAIGVRLEDGTEHCSDIVISAADGRTTLFRMLEGKYINQQIKSYYDHMPIIPAPIYVAVGVDRDLSAEPHTINYMLAEPIHIGNVQQNNLNVRITAFDPTLAPKGKTVILTAVGGDYRYWQELSKDRDRYEAKKKEIANQIIQFLEGIYPGISGQVEMVDVATSITFERYTGNWEGSILGWIATSRSITTRMKQTLPGLDNFYLAGHWVEPGGGVSPAASSGRKAAQLICHKDKREFVTTLP